jgi:hypothetical protein
MITPIVYEKERLKKTDSSEDNPPSKFSIFGMSTADTLQSLLLLLALATAIIACAAAVISGLQFRHLKLVETNKLTTDLWKQFLDNYDILGGALLKFQNPMSTDAIDFSNIQYIRNWIDGFVMLAKNGILNNEMIKSFGFQGPIKDFMTSLQEAVGTLKVNAVLNKPGASDLLEKYQKELSSCDDIINWLKTL